MQTFVVRVLPESGTISPWHSDTIFGHICWMIYFMDGEGVLRDFLGEYRAGRAPLVTSNGFPSNLLPAPLLKPRQQIPPYLPKNEAMALFKEIKRVKSLMYLHEENFIRLAHGESMDYKEKPETHVKTVEIFHNQVSRLSNTTGSSGQLYGQDETFFGSSTVSIYLKIADGWVDAAKRWVEAMGHYGFGKRRTVGKGAFNVLEFDRFSRFENFPGANGVIILSNYVPAKGDPAQGRYKLGTKYGKLGGLLANADNPFKHPFNYLVPGSAFLVNEEIKPYYGRIIEGIAPGQKEVVQYALGFPVPAVFH